jgi:hypothetical protein
MEMKGIWNAYKISRRCERESTEESKQPTEEGEGDGYEHCERCNRDGLQPISLVC